MLCGDQERSFVGASTYRRGFKPPHTFVQHTCDATRVDLAQSKSSRGNKSSCVALLDSTLQFVMDKGLEASPAAE